MEARKIDQDFIWDVLIDPDKWTENKLDTNKGIILMGNPGVGKTHFMEQFALRNSKICWGHPKMPSGMGLEDCSTLSIRRACERMGSLVLQGFEDHELFLDDLGSEPHSMTRFYGMEIDPIVELFMIRYRIRKVHKTHITTNYNLEDLEKFYGQRVTDRIKEMCNILILTGDSFRK